MYDHVSVEDKWRRHWKESGIFRFDPKDSKKKVYIIDTPPPFTNGALHMGQTFWVCYIDAIARYKRMAGLNVLYPQGWDAHGFPTEIAVEKKHGKHLPRDEFYKKCVEESIKNIATMRDEMLKLGSTFDDKFEYYTTSDDYMAKVQLSVIEMFEKGFVYRGAHPVEWCVYCETPISREVAEERQEETDFNYLDFEISGARKQKITIATTRPEMLHACVALAVNPTDKRFSKLIGGKAVVPLFGREVPIIGDGIVDKEVGTGAEMVCTFGDKRDVALYYKHKLDLIEAIDEAGKLKNADTFTGLKIKDAKAKILEALKEKKLLKKQEKISHAVKVHDRCGNKIELIQSLQWFMKIKEHSEKIKEVATTIRWVPEFAKQRLDDWANFIEWDWAISRNRIFGTPIPFWYCEKCGDIVAADKSKLPVDPAKHRPPVENCPKCGWALTGAKETLDGWIDSSITPLAISGWPSNKKLMESGFPTAVRIQGTDIIRTWAFYTIYRTWALTTQKPWASIISHGMILAMDGREMHKSWGNSIYPTDVMKKYSIDSIRLWVALSGGIIKDRPFSYQDMDFAKSFTTKLFNTANFVKLAIGKGKPPKKEPHKDLNIFDMWILNRLNSIIREATEAFDNYMLHEAMTKLVNFYWHEFADFYIEDVKHRIYSEDEKMQPSRAAAAFTLMHVMDASLRMLAPVVPHVCEEINAMFAKDSIFKRDWPKWVEIPKGPSYAVNGLLFSATIEVDPEAAGMILNNIIADIRKQKANARVALNKEVASINIKVPEEYYTIVDTSKEELAQICKAKAINLKKGDYSIEVKM
ncbi:MAG: valine--tRNA ligase [Candidatus Micrarchaeota archaeon]|nr:valine--tRNA ligase [Candidatus Micrarchaeota archaeon]